MKAPYKLLVLTASMISFLITGYSKNNYTRVKNLALTDCEHHRVSKMTDTVYWENLNYDEQNVIIAKIKSSTDIVSYYVKNNYIVNDYNQMDSLLNALTKAQNENDKKCLYFHLFNEIAIKSDGDLAEMVFRILMQ